jgi:hypothetical protein
LIVVVGVIPECANALPVDDDIELRGVDDTSPICDSDDDDEEDSEDRGPPERCVGCCCCCCRRLEAADIDDAVLNIDGAARDDVGVGDGAEAFRVVCGRPRDAVEYDGVEKLSCLRGL